MQHIYSNFNLIEKLSIFEKMQSNPTSEKKLTEKAEVQNPQVEAL